MILPYDLKPYSGKHMPVKEIYSFRMTITPFSEKPVYVPHHDISFVAWQCESILASQGNDIWITNTDIRYLGDTGSAHHEAIICSNSAFLCWSCVLHIISMTNLALRKPMQSTGTTSGNFPTLPHPTGAHWCWCYCKQSASRALKQQQKTQQSENFQNMPLYKQITTGSSPFSKYVYLAKT